MKIDCRLAMSRLMAPCLALFAVAGVLRGGSWSNYPWHLRSAARRRNLIGLQLNDVGFRVARTINRVRVIRRSR